VFTVLGSSLMHVPGIAPPQFMLIKKGRGGFIMFSIATLTAVILLAVLPAKGLPGEWLSADELNATFGGKTIEGEYPNKRSFRETYNLDGGLAYQDDRRQSGGHWSIKSGSLCTIYDDDPAGGCFRVQKAGPNCYEFYFIARTEERAENDPSDKPSWTARGWMPDKPAACSERADV
jgi:hypothetical protein